MINIDAYEETKTRVNKNKTWYDPKTGYIISKEITHRKYFTILSKYLPEIGYTTYYILLFDVKNSGSSTRLDDYGRTKLLLNNEEKRMLELTSITAPKNITLSLIDKDDDSELYKVEL